MLPDLEPTGPLNAKLSRYIALRKQICTVSLNTSTELIMWDPGIQDMRRAPGRQRISQHCTRPSFTVDMASCRTR